MVSQSRKEWRYSFSIYFRWDVCQCRGVKKDDVKAIEWWRKAGDQGHIKAQYSLGEMYRTSKGVKQDYTKAFKWFRKAAEQGDGSAQFNLGVGGWLLPGFVWRCSCLIISWLVTIG